LAVVFFEKLKMGGSAVAEEAMADKGVAQKR
jgi:hypothetical protein